MKYLVFLLMFLVISCGPICRENKKIIRIGGCDGGGICGVLYNDGTNSTELRPVVGQVKQVMVECK